jgi:6-pyruvoyltetrahydropterin/6-carboxytetrahydropterin synthase
MPAKTVRRKKAVRHPLVLAGTVYITRQVHFNAAHRLCNPTKTLAWNQRQYGPCANPHWHGHNYVLEVTVRGRPHPETGYIVDLSELKGIVQRAVVDHCDHRNLNTEVSFLRGTIPSAENLVIAFWREIAPHLPASAALHRVRLYETPCNFADFYGPDAP